MRNQTNSRKEFVLTQPEDVKAAEVVRRARVAGFEMREQYVHVVRSNARKAAGSKRLVANDMEGELIELALTVGLLRASELLQKARRAFASPA